MTRHDPHATLPEVPELEVTSVDLTAGEPVPAAHWAAAVGGDELSPQLAWRGLPEGTRSLVVTAYDPDAPTGSGYWHWAVYNIPADVTELPRGAGSGDTDAALPEGAVTLPNETRTRRYIGPNPPRGTGRHRYFFTVHALDRMLDLDPDTTPAVLGFTCGPLTLARGVLVATAEHGDLPG